VNWLELTSEIAVTTLSSCSYIEDSRHKKKVSRKIEAPKKPRNDPVPVLFVRRGVFSLAVRSKFLLILPCETKTKMVNE